MRIFDRITRPDFDRLASGHELPSVSLYLPTERSGRETRQGAIRLKNLTARAEAELKKLDWRWNEIEEILKPAHELMADTEFWLYQADGLALYLARGVADVYRLPRTFPEFSVVGETFFVKPLLPLLSLDGLYYILTLSENQTRIFESTRFSIQEIEVEGVPMSMAEALAADDRESQLQLHTGASAAVGVSKGAIFHGSGDEAGMELQKSNLKRYFDKVDAPLRDWLVEAPAPLLIMGVDYLLPIYRQANQYGELLDAEVHGNFDRATPEDIHGKAWPAVEPHFDQSRKAAVDRFLELNGTGMATSHLPEIVGRAHEGRVETLFVALEQTFAGQFDPATASVTEGGEHAEDLLNRAATETLRRGGTVFAVDPDKVPGGQLMAAIMRY